MRRPPLHPACKIFPALGEPELQELADDIAENGLRNPIVMLKGKLLDGRNRWEACKIAKVEPHFTEFDGDDPIGWVVSLNLVRRHLTASQRAVVAFDLLPMMEKEAKQRQRQANSYKGNGRLLGPLRTILQQRPSTWRLGGLATCCRPRAYSAIHFVAQEPCSKPVLIAEPPR